MLNCQVFFDNLIKELTIKNTKKKWGDGILGWWIYRL